MILPENCPDPDALRDRLARAALRRGGPAGGTRSVVVLGTHNVGALMWCEAKATFRQLHNGPAFASRGLQIWDSPGAMPEFVRPHKALRAIEPVLPSVDHSTGGEAWEVAEREETGGCWGLGLVAAFRPSDLGLDSDAEIFVVGVPDGVRGDGTVIEVRQSRWSWRRLEASGEVAAKEIQANLYAVLLGLPRWSCVYRCGNSRQERSGAPDEGAALGWLRKAAAFRLGLVNPAGVPPALAERCRTGGGTPCDYLAECPVSQRR